MSRALTPKQHQALIAVSRGEVVSRNHGYGAWRIVGAPPTVVGRLVSLGFIRWTKPLGGLAVLTEVGMAHLTAEVSQ